MVGRESGEVRLGEIETESQVEPDDVIDAAYLAGTAVNAHERAGYNRIGKARANASCIATRWEGSGRG